MIEKYNFNNFGYLLSDIDEELKNDLHGEMNFIRNNFDSSIRYNKFLAGHIKHEYKISSSLKSVERVVLALANEYENTFNYYNQVDMLTDDLPMCVENAWINFQSKGEFNPVHNHRGLYSFVIWLKIPYDLDEELSTFDLSGDPKNKKSINSIFQFLYVNSLGQISTHQIYVNKKFENKILLFPAKTMHCVYPFFTSDEYRVSVAGNVMLNSSKR
jgi:hypothetical protein